MTSRIGSRRLQLLLASSLVIAGPLLAEEGTSSLVRCAAAEPAHAVLERSREMADFLGTGYSESYPAAVALGGSTAEIAAVLDGQLRAVEPARAAFFEAWERFDTAVRRSPLPRDPTLRQVLTAYKHSATELGQLLGCEAGAADAMVPCPAIPIAHLLAVLGAQMDGYIEARGYGEQYPDQAAAATALAGVSRELHEVLHDLEIAVPGVRGTFDTLKTSLAGSALTDTDEPDDLAVKSRLTALEEAMAALDQVVGSCHDTEQAAAPEIHDHR